MSPFFALFFVLLLGSSSYAAGRLHGQLSYRIGYRQGFFDGDRAGWNRRRREAQAAIASGTGAQAAIASATGAPPPSQNRTRLVRQGTTYTSASVVGAASSGGRHSTKVG